MKAHGKAEPFPGKKLYQQRAEQALPLLVRQAHAHKEITYKSLSNEMGMKNPRNLNYVLGSVGFTLRNLAKNWGEDIPPIQTIVVNKATGIPGSGGQWFAAGDGYDKLDSKTRDLLIQEKHRDVFIYPKWRQVLRHLKLPEVEVTYDALFEAAAKSGRGAGESQRHKNLKTEVCAQPELAGLDSLKGKGRIEHPLPSGDWLDVCFETPDRLAAVEVKTITSNDDDITRGLFQCVKYLAVMESVIAIKRSKQLASCVLLLEGHLPASLLGIKNALGVKVFELNRKI